MKNKSKTPTWDSIISVLLCGIIALTALCIGVQWLKKPAYVDKLLADYNEVTSVTDTSGSDKVSSSDTSTIIVDASQPASEITSETTVVDDIEPEEKQYLIVVVNKAVMRKSNSVEAEKITYIKKDTKVEVIEKSGRWYKIEYKNKIGWIHKNCVEVCE